MEGIVQVCCGGKHPCHCVRPASAMGGFNGVLRSVYFHDTNAHGPRLMTVPCSTCRTDPITTHGRRADPASLRGALPSSTLLHGQNPGISLTTVPFVFESLWHLR